MYGSECTVHRDAKNKSIDERGKPAIISGRSDETKGYRVYLKENIFVVMKHVRNVETLTSQQNEQLRRVHFAEEDEASRKEVTTKEPGPKRDPKLKKEEDKSRVEAYVVSR